nr:unnamed protein product [Digitaria exilis]
MRRGKFLEVAAVRVEREDLGRGRSCLDRTEEDMNSESWRLAEIAHGASSLAVAQVASITSTCSPRVPALPRMSCRRSPPKSAHLLPSSFFSDAACPGGQLAAVGFTIAAPLDVREEGEDAHCRRPSSPDLLRRTCPTSSASLPPVHPATVELLRHHRVAQATELVLDLHRPHRTFTTLTRRLSTSTTHPKALSPLALELNPSLEIGVARDGLRSRLHSRRGRERKGRKRMERKCPSKKYTAEPTKQEAKLRNEERQRRPRGHLVAAGVWKHRIASTLTLFQVSPRDFVPGRAQLGDARDVDAASSNSTSSVDESKVDLVFCLSLPCPAGRDLGSLIGTKARVAPSCYCCQQGALVCYETMKECRANCPPCNPQCRRQEP